MATIRPGKTRVLLVVDMQTGILAHAWERERVVANVSQLVTRAREAGTPVIWVQHHDAELPRDSKAWQWTPELRPLEGERTIHKSANSAFEQTGLEQELAGLGASHIVLTGVMTNWCIRATAYAALDRGYDLTLVKDAHTTEDLKPSADRVIPARDLVDELNVAIRWLAYPGRRNTTAKTAEVDFIEPATSDMP
ncbi:MAG: isochorismatase family protein [Dyella sp.]|nr:isochorismatase family protein [Dyella sp.]